MKNDTEQTRDKIVTELKRIAFANGADYAGIDADNLGTLSRARRSAVKEAGKNGVVLYDKFKAIELLGKRYGLFNGDIDNAPPPPVVIVDDLANPALIGAADGYLSS